jgi:hypothetical protein
VAQDGRVQRVPDLSRRRAKSAGAERALCSQTRTYMFDLDLRWRTVAAFCAASNTSRADVVPATCSVPSTPRSIHPAFTASNISSGSGAALGDTELLERFRPLCTRDCKGSYVKLQDFTQLLRDFVRGDHRTKLDDALPRPDWPGQDGCDLRTDVVRRDPARFPACWIIV